MSFPPIVGHQTASRSERLRRYTASLLWWDWQSDGARRSDLRPTPRRRDTIVAILAAVLVVVCAGISAVIVLAVYRVEIHRLPSLGIMAFVGFWFLVVYSILAFAVHPG
jgi:hypothetical protein